MAKTIVITAGNPSGIAATAKLIAFINKSKIPSASIFGSANQLNPKTNTQIIVVVFCCLWKEVFLIPQKLKKEG